MTTPDVEFPATKTPITNAEWHGVIRPAWRRFEKSEPTAAALRLLWAMWALETGNGEGFWNGNFGNLTKGAADAEFANGWMTLKTSAGPIVFAAYPSFFAGANDWMRYFGRPSWKPVVAAFQTGDAAALAHELKLRNYYGDGSEDEYRNGLVNRAKLYKPSSAGIDTRSDAGGFVALGIGVGLGWLALRGVGGSRA